MVAAARTVGAAAMGSASRGRTAAGKGDQVKDPSSPSRRRSQQTHPVFAKHARAIKHLLPQTVSSLLDTAVEAGELDRRIAASEVS